MRVSYDINHKFLSSHEIFCKNSFKIIFPQRVGKTVSTSYNVFAAKPQ